MNKFWNLTTEEERLAIRRSLDICDVSSLIKQGSFEPIRKYPKSADYGVRKQCDECGHVHKSETGEKAYRDAIKAYRRAVAKREELFRYALIVENGLAPDLESSHAAFAYAWAQGHSNGYYEVANIMPEIAEIVKQTIKDVG